MLQPEEELPGSQSGTDSGHASDPGEYIPVVPTPLRATVTTTSDSPLFGANKEPIIDLQSQPPLKRRKKRKD